MEIYWYIVQFHTKSQILAAVIWHNPEITERRWCEKEIFLKREYLTRISLGTNLSGPTRDPAQD